MTYGWQTAHLTLNNNHSLTSHDLRLINCSLDAKKIITHLLVMIYGWQTVHLKLKNNQTSDILSYGNQNIIPRNMWIPVMSFPTPFWCFPIVECLRNCCLVPSKRASNIITKTQVSFWWRRVWRYQRGNKNPYIEEEQIIQWPKENVQKHKQRSTKHTYKTKDRVTRTH